MGMLQHSEKVIGCDILVFSDCHLSRTRANIFSGSTGAYVFRLFGRQASYHIKGRIEYQRTGPYFDMMRSFATAENPTFGAVVLHADEVYRGDDRLV